MVILGCHLKLAYLVNTYPRASHTFIRREIQALERIAVPVHRFAMRSDRDALVDAGAFICAALGRVTSSRVAKALLARTAEARKVAA